MNFNINKTHFQPQHRSRCYCENGDFCCCIGMKDSSVKPIRSHQFIKTHSNASKNKSFLRANSNSISSGTTLMTPISNPLISHHPPSVESRHTEMREFYERSKDVASQTLDVRLLGVPVQAVQHCDDDIAKLQQFRLQNADECLSTCSRFSMSKTYKSRDKSDVSDVVNEKYVLNKRGLLELVGTQSTQAATPKKKIHIPAAIVANPRSVAKDVLRLKLHSTKEKEKFIRKSLCLPENSLALRYQKTY